MANEKQLIRQLSMPTIVLDDLEAQDLEDGTAVTFGKPKSPVKMSKQFGAVAPMVQINKQSFQGDQIVEMMIYSTGEIPRASVTFNVNDKSFYSTSFPKDGDVITIFVRSKNNIFKPIRNDYEITSVSVSSRQGTGEGSTEEIPDSMTVTGVLKIPGYYATKCFSKRGTSMNALHNIAADLKLGFSSNEIDTDDSQTWICPNDKVRNFIQDTALASWKDRNSFYVTFIDPYYSLNFVNIDPLFSDTIDIEDALIKNTLFNDYTSDEEKAEGKGKVVLTDWDDMSSTNFFIESYELRNMSASINNKHGYRRFVMMYDGFTKEPSNIFVDPITSTDAEKDKILLKGRAGEEFYKEQVEKKWMGIQYGDDGENCHEKFNYARISNFQNNVHLDKMSLVVHLEKPNFNLRRMQPVPVVIVIKKDFNRKKINEPIDESEQKSMKTDAKKTNSIIKADETPMTIDKTISGNYVIKDIIYKYIKGKFKQECVLIRREWPTPPQTY